MAELVLTPVEIKSKLDTDKYFAVQFVVQNQPNIVVDRLKAKGLTKIDTPDKAYSYLTALIDVDPDTVREILNGIPYDPAAPNWTGTMDDYFPKVQTKAGGFWSGILAGIASITGAVAGTLGGNPGTPLTAEQIEAARKEEERRQEELKRAQQRKYLVAGLIALAVIVIGVMWYNSGKSTDAK